MIEQFHQTYVAVTGFKDVRLVPPFDRWLFDLMKAGVTPQDLELLLRERKRLIKIRRKWDSCILLSRICGDDTYIGDAINEIAAIKARMRCKGYTPDKASVLRATGRPDAPQPMVAKHIADVLRKAIDSV